MEHEDSEFIRLPGLFRRWEIEQVIDVGADFHFEEAGTCCDGTPLVAVYRRDARLTTTAIRLGGRREEPRRPLRGGETPLRWTRAARPGER